MTSSFRQSIMKMKIDAANGDKLLDETNRFFDNNRALLKMTSKTNSSVKSLRQAQSRRVQSTIY